MSRVEGVRRLALRSSYWEGAFYSLVVALAENFALVFAVSRQLSPAELGVLTTLPMLLGALGNLIIPRFAQQKDLKKWLMALVSLQILGIASLFATVAFVNENVFSYLLVALSIYWMGGFGATPLWLDWMSGWLPGSKLGAYFSKRSSVLSLVTLAFTLVCSAAAKYFDGIPAFFGWVFVIALVSRVVSLAILASRPDPLKRVREKPAQDFRWRGLFHSVRAQDSLRPLWLILTASVLFRFVANVSSPYFLPYMMSDLGFSTGLVTFLQAITYISTFLFIASFANCIQKFSLTTAVLVSFFGIVAVSTAWIFCTSPIAIAGIQFFNGLFWAGLDLSIILWIQSAFPQRARSLMGLHLALVQAGAVLGSLVGAHLMSDFGYTHIDLIEISTWMRAAIAFMLSVSLSVYTVESVSLMEHSRFLVLLFSKPVFRRNLQR